MTGCIPSSNGTAQPQDNVRTCLECVQDESRTHARRVWNAREMRPKRAQDTSVQAQNLEIKLQQDLT